MRRREGLDMERRARGFSLIELVIVAAILAIWAGIAVPRVANTLDRHRADAVARRVVRDLKYAQTRARITSSRQTVAFNCAQGGYELVGLADTDYAGHTYKIKLSDEPYRAELVQVSFAGSAQVVFDAYGSPGSGGSVVMRVGSHQRTVVVDGQTGQVNLQ